jgi:c-di-GMP-related signal transduction protein
MDIFIARQPIFDRNMNVYGYELLYRHNCTNSFNGMDDDLATAALIYNTFLVVGIDHLTDGTKAFINFSKELLGSEVPYLLPTENVVIEVLEREQVTQATIDACCKLRDAGYVLALDDFIVDDNNASLLSSANIIKIEYEFIQENLKLIENCRGKALLLAEKIETREDYQKAVDMGFDLFQGYFFSKPVILNSKDIVPLNLNLIRIIDELNSQEPSYTVIADIIESDLGISIKLLKMANSVYRGTRTKIKSIKHTLSLWGVKEIYQWISLMLLKEVQNIENAELIKQAFIRGRLMALIGAELRKDTPDSDYFFTGMFSTIDTLLNKPMDQVLKDLPLSGGVKCALLGDDNELRQSLNCILYYENADWNQFLKAYPMNLIGAEKFLDLYVEALKWTNQLNY